MTIKFNKTLIWLLLSFATLAQGGALYSGVQTLTDLKPQRYEAKAAHLAAEVLSRYHYKPTVLDSASSEKVLAQYLKALDDDKYFFLQEDIDRFTSDQGQLGSAILQEDLSLPFAIFNWYEKRVVERFEFARTLLKQPMDFQLHEDLPLARDKSAWSQSEAEIRDLWRRRVKNDWLRLKIAGQDSASIGEILDKRYVHAIQRINRTKSEDAFQTFMNAFTMSIDPHTNYMLPKTAEEFDISMRLSLTGIGATLSESEDYTTVRELVPGGPAALSGQLQVGDRIVAVGQSAAGPMTDILGWRSDDAIELIRGAADTVVRLDILPADAEPNGKHKQVSLVRKPVHLNEQAASSTIQSITTGNATHRIGVITLPLFYQDFAAREAGDKDYRSATSDVKRLIEDLKTKQIESVLIDLRNNGGGSLTEAIELSSLFLGNVPVVQQRRANGSISVEQTSQAKAVWKGPMGVLINRGSASASEIFAAAIQDYGRGLVLGDRSFGKGTVQTMVDLDRIAKNETPRFGELKMTIAQFFRVNGGTTQLRGVVPDIPLQEGSDQGDFGESSFANALPWNQVQPANYRPSYSLRTLTPALYAIHENRVKTDAEMQRLFESIAKSRHMRESNTISLNEEDRRAERIEQESVISLDSAIDHGSESIANRAMNETLDDGLQPDEKSLTDAIYSKNARKNAKDLLLLEAVHILSDAVTLFGADSQLADGNALAHGPVNP